MPYPFLEASPQEAPQIAFARRIETKNARLALANTPTPLRLAGQRKGFGQAFGEKS
jgi:hypothetical protein